jgi:ATP-dependent Lhr-like helicase
VVGDNDGRLRWWTFAGQRANHVLARVLSAQLQSDVKVGNLALDFEARLSLDDIQSAIAVVSQSDFSAVRPAVDDSVIEGLKFSACLPTPMALEMLGERLADASGAKQILSQRVRFMAEANQEV